MKYKTLRNILIFWCFFIGIGAVGGSIGMLSAPDGSNLGMQDLIPYFQVLPFADVLFQNYIFPGISLLIVNGITNIIAGILLIKNKSLGIKLGGIFGITLMLWIIIQFIIFPKNFMSETYFKFGIAQALTGWFCFVAYKRENLKFDVNDYKNINKESKNIVVYFSRNGYTKKVAYEVANENKADIYEIKTTEKINGIKGFLWCGRFAMHRWPMNIEKCDIDFSIYDKVIICSPVWDFTLSAPVREFCLNQSEKIKNVEYVLMHTSPFTYTYIARQMNEILKIKENTQLHTKADLVGSVYWSKNIEL